MKIKLNSDDEKCDAISYTVIVGRSVFHGGNKYYPQIFLGECWHKL